MFFVSVESFRSAVISSRLIPVVVGGIGDVVGDFGETLNVVKIWPRVLPANVRLNQLEINSVCEIMGTSVGCKVCGLAIEEEGRLALTKRILNIVPPLGIRRFHECQC